MISMKKLYKAFPGKEHVDFDRGLDEGSQSRAELSLGGKWLLLRSGRGNAIGWRKLSRVGTAPPGEKSHR